MPKDLHPTSIKLCNKMMCKSQLMWNGGTQVNPLEGRYPAHQLFTTKLILSNRPICLWVQNSVLKKLQKVLCLRFGCKSVSSFWYIFATWILVYGYWWSEHVQEAHQLQVIQPTPTCPEDPAWRKRKRTKTGDYTHISHFCITLATGQSLFIVSAGFKKLNMKYSGLCYEEWT